MGCPQIPVSEMDSHVYSIINCVGSRAAENFRQLHLSFTISFQFEAHKCNIWRCRTNYFLQNQSDFHWHPTFFILQFNCRIYNYNCRFFQNPNCRILQFNCRKKKVWFQPSNSFGRLLRIALHTSPHTDIGLNSYSILNWKYSWF